MEDNNYLAHLNLLRLDSCFHFLSLDERIEIHHCSINAITNKVSKQNILKYERMMSALEEMDWHVPEFHILTENSEGKKEWNARGKWKNISEAEWAKDWMEEFTEFKIKAKI